MEIKLSKSKWFKKDLKIYNIFNIYQTGGKISRWHQRQFNLMQGDKIDYQYRYFLKFTG